MERSCGKRNATGVRDLERVTDLRPQLAEGDIKDGRRRLKEVEHLPASSVDPQSIRVRWLSAHPSRPVTGRRGAQACVEVQLLSFIRKGDAREANPKFWHVARLDVHLELGPVEQAHACRAILLVEGSKPAHGLPVEQKRGHLGQLLVQRVTRLASVCDFDRILLSLTMDDTAFERDAEEVESFFDPEPWDFQLASLRHISLHDS